MSFLKIKKLQKYYTIGQFTDHTPYRTKIARLGWFISKRETLITNSSLFDNEYPGYRRTILDAKIYLLTTLTNFGVD